MEPEVDLQGWQRLPADLLDSVAERLTRRDHKAISLTCKHWKQVIRRRARKAAVRDDKRIKPLLVTLPQLVELHLNGIPSALTEQAVQAMTCHTSLRSLHLNNCHVQPAMLEALAAAGKLPELHVNEVQPPEEGPLPQVQLTGWSSLRKLRLSNTGSQEVLNALLSSFNTIPQLTELSVTYRSKAGQQAHDSNAARDQLAQLPATPQLKSLRLDYSGLTQNHHILPQTSLTSLALVNELQLPDGFFDDLRVQTALRALDLSSWAEPRPATLTNANIAAVLPHLPHLTYLSLAGCSALHMSCLSSLRTSCPELQHLNIASLQRNGALPLLSHLTHLDISCDHGDAAGYPLRTAILHVNMCQTVLGDSFTWGLSTRCPDLACLDARGCKKLTSYLGIHSLAKCRRLKVLLLDGSGIGCTGTAYLMLRRGDLRLAEDLGSDALWSFEPWANDAVILLKQAGATLRDRGFVRFAFFLWAFDHMLFGLSCLRLVFWWLGVALSGMAPAGPQLMPKGFVHSTLAVIIPIVLSLRGVRSIGQLGVIFLSLALPGLTSSIPGVLRWVTAWATMGRIVSVYVFVGRWLVSPAFERLCSRPTVSRAILFAAALCCASWVLLNQLWVVQRMALRALPVLPSPVNALVMGLSTNIMPCLGLLGTYMLAFMCSMVVMRE